jgi:exosortase
MMVNLKASSQRVIAFVSSTLLIAVAVFILQSVGHLGIGGDYNSQTVLIPLLCGYLLWNQRERIFAVQSFAPRKAAPFAAAALIASFAALYLHSEGHAYLFSAVSLLAAILVVNASFVALFGSAALRRAAFPFVMLLLALPLPDSVVQAVISILQAQSAWLSAVLFSILGIPVYREGIMLSVPGITIEVARECSGINSSIALVLTMLLVARESLNSNWRRVVLIAASIPLSILKNAIRITTLTVLALRVDPSFLTGRLHHEGGFVFYLIAMALMYPIWKLLKRGDSVLDSRSDLPAWQASLRELAPKLPTGA